jgi:hypothetical protein
MIGAVNNPTEINKKSIPDFKDIGNIIFRLMPI